MLVNKAYSSPDGSKDGQPAVPKAVLKITGLNKSYLQDRQVVNKNSTHDMMDFVIEL